MVKNMGRGAATQICAFNGCEHTMVVLKNGSLMAFGYNNHGQLGSGNNQTQPTPKLVRGLENRQVTVLSCSLYHSVVAVLEMEVLAFGRNDFGQLGLGDTSHRSIPQSILRLKGRTITSLACGQYHTCIVSGDGTVRSSKM